MNVVSNLQKTYGRITVDSVGPSLNTKKAQAQVRQIVTTLYPGARAASSLSDGLFKDADFGVGESYEEARVTWIPVPLGTTKKQVEAQLAKHPNARLVKTLSFYPVLSDEQKRAIDTGLSTKTMAEYEEEVVLDSEGTPVKYKGRTFHRAINFRATQVEDIDLRESQLADFEVLKMAGKAGVAEQKEF